MVSMGDSIAPQVKALSAACSEWTADELRAWYVLYLELQYHPQYYLQRAWYVLYLELQYHPQYTDNTLHRPYSTPTDELKACSEQPLQASSIGLT